MTTTIQIIQAPYYCGMKHIKQGLGPSRFIEMGLGQILADHQISRTRFENIMNKILK